MRKTILALRPQVDDHGQERLYRTFSYRDGRDGAAVDVIFADGSEGSYASNPTNVEKHVTSLNALVDKESDFELEKRDDFNGIPQFKIRDYPGKPTGGFQGGFQGGGGGARETSEEREERQKLIVAQSAVKAAVELSASFEDADTRMEWVWEHAPEMFALTLEIANGVSPTWPPGTVRAVPAPTQTLAEGLTQQVAAARAPEPAATQPDNWQAAHDAAVAAYGSQVRLQIALRADPKTLSADDLWAAAEAAPNKEG